MRRPLSVALALVILAQPIMANLASAQSQERPEDPGEKSIPRGAEVIEIQSAESVSVSEVDPNAVSWEPGRVAWTTEFDEEVNWWEESSQGILFASTGGRLHGVDALTGRRLWELNVHSDSVDVLEVLLTPIVVLVHAADTAEAFERKETYSMAFDQYTGEVLWKNEAILGRPLVTVPLYERQALFLKTINPISGGKMAGKMAGATALKMVGFGKAAKKAQNPDGKSYLIDLATGRQLWVRTLDDPQNAKYRTTSAGAVEQLADKVRGFDMDTGENRWKLELDNRVVEVNGDRFLIGKNRKLGSYDLASGTKKQLKQEPYWQTELSPGLEGIRAISVNAEQVYVASQGGFASAAVENGGLSWSHELEERGKPAALVLSRDGSKAVGSLYHWDSKTDLRLLVMDTSTGAEIARYPVERTKKGKPTFIKISEDHSIRWIDEEHILVEQDSMDSVLKLSGRELEVLWQRQTPEEVLFPDEKELAEKIKKRERMMGILLLVGGFVLDSVAGNAGSDLAKALLLVAGSAAVAAGAYMLYQSAQSKGEILENTSAVSNSRVAYDRFMERQENINPLVRLELIEASEASEAAYEVQRVDLRSGKIIDRTQILNAGRLSLDQSFSLAHQRTIENKRVIQAVVLPGFSASLFEDFSIEGVTGS